MKKMQKTAKRRIIFKKVHSANAWFVNIVNVVFNALDIPSYIVHFGISKVYNIGWQKCTINIRISVHSCLSLYNRIIFVENQWVI